MGIPSEQFGVTFANHNAPLEYHKIPVPKVGHDEVLVNIKYTGVCHTDLHAWKGDWPLAIKKNLVGGHEGAGVVVQVGENVKDVKIGDHAGIKWLNGSCGSCEFCMKSFESSCPHALLSGYTVDGSFQQYAIGKAAHVARIPKSVDLAEASSILCAGITVYKALKDSEARPGEWVVIPGAGGGLGHLAIQYATAMGLRVVAIDAGKEKEELCKKLGAEAFIDFQTSSDVISAVKDITNGGAQAAIVVASTAKPFEDATKMVKSKGVVVAVGLPSKAKIGADVFDTVVRSLTIKGSYVGNRADTAEALDFLERGKVKVFYQIRGLSELPKVYEEMEQGKIAGRIVLDTYK